MMGKYFSKFDEGKTIVYFIRHGERIHIKNSAKTGLRIPGPKLSPKGKKQAKEVSKEIKKLKGKIDVFITSGMNRAIETSEIIGQEIGMKAKKYPELSEFNGKLWSKKILKKEFWENHSLHKKAIKKFDKILEENKGKVIVAVLHGNIIKSLIFRKAGVSYKVAGMFHHRNCGISIARYEGKRLEHISCINSNSIEHSSLTY